MQLLKFTKIYLLGLLMKKNKFIKSKDKKIIDDFGLEWERFNQINLDKKELFKIFNDYFSIPIR